MSKSTVFVNKYFYEYVLAIFWLGCPNRVPACTHTEVAMDALQLEEILNMYSSERKRNEKLPHMYTNRTEVRTKEQKMCSIFINCTRTDISRHSSSMALEEQNFGIGFPIPC